MSVKGKVKRFNKELIKLRDDLETENHIVYYINNDEKIGNIEEDDIDLTGELDTIYDLIQADLVVRE